ncbi:MAG: serine/threonine-protein phosphatase [Magnetococcales bacterium]|nr:serine/threonine-protein phosphatase [Magnetococcales bacterium]
MAPPKKRASGLFDQEERIIHRAAALLQQEATPLPELRSAFSELVNAYKKLHRQSVRLNRISDRNQLALRNSEQLLTNTLAHLRRHQDKLSMDQELVEEILTKMHSNTRFDGEGIHHLLQPVDKASGDILFSSRRPDRVRHILLGDITGHGLPAAIVGPEVSDVFHAMTHKGFAPLVILAEINHRLRERLPTGIYLAATMLELDESSWQLSIWNGGIPDGMLFRNNHLHSLIPSNSFPLGLTENKSQHWQRTVIHLEPGDHIFFFTDGIIEPRNQKEEMFGIERLGDLLADYLATETPLEQIVTSLNRFIGKGAEIDDDLTIVELFRDS